MNGFGEHHSERVWRIKNELTEAKQTKRKKNGRQNGKDKV